MNNPIVKKITLNNNSQNQQELTNKIQVFISLIKTSQNIKKWVTYNWIGGLFTKN